MKGRTDIRTYVVRTDVDDVMAIKPNFLTSMGYHIFLSMVLRARASSARAELRYYYANYAKINCIVFAIQHGRLVMWVKTKNS